LEKRKASGGEGAPKLALQRKEKSSNREVIGETIFEYNEREMKRTLRFGKALCARNA